MPYANSNGASIYYEVHGNSGSPLVMLHGHGCSIADWLPEQIQVLSTQHQVILIDNRGVGQSDKPTTPYSMALFAADTVCVLDLLQIEQAHIFGLSMGGIIAQHVALGYPQRVLSLLLASTTATAPGHARFVSPSEEVLIHFAKPPSGNWAQDTRNGWKLAYTSAFIESHQNLLERKLLARLAYPEPAAYALQLQFEAILKTHDTLNQLPQIQCPTLILAGTEDVLIPAENSRLMMSFIPQARLIEYMECGHELNVECCEKFTQDVLVFLQKIDQGDLYTV